MRRRDRKQSDSPPAATRRKKSAKLTDLCAEDKSKIGELVKKLASETRLRQDSENRLTLERQSAEQKLQEMENKTKRYEQEREEMR